jgi:hypothetical protein
VAGLEQSPNKRSRVDLLETSVTSKHVFSSFSNVDGLRIEDTKKIFMYGGFDSYIQLKLLIC